MFSGPNSNLYQAILKHLHPEHLQKPAELAPMPADSDFSQAHITPPQKVLKLESSHPIPALLSQAAHPQFALKGTGHSCGGQTLTTGIQLQNTHQRIQDLGHASVRVGSGTPWYA
ncbi:MAG: hypothetical protein VCC04_01045, partial [Myxococcota bacterium]